jgi:hypothetical protein
MQYLCFCYSGDLKYTTKVYALKDYPAPPWYYWEVVEPLRYAALWKFFFFHQWGCALKGGLGTQPPSLSFASSHEVSEPLPSFSPAMVCSNRASRS